MAWKPRRCARIGVWPTAMEGAMSLKDDSDLDRHEGWFGAALVFAVGLMAATLLMGVEWTSAPEGDALALRSPNSRQMVIMPLPNR